MTSEPGAPGTAGLSGTMLFGVDHYPENQWNDDMPSIDENNSPKPLLAPLRPISYTTVGSLANTAPPHFNAPNRIQRENAGRRPPTNPMARPSDGYYNPRTQLPQLGASSYSSGSSSQYNPYGGLPPMEPHRLSDFEKEAFLRSLGVGTPPSMRSGNIPQPSFGAPRPSTSSTDPFLSSGPAQLFSARNIPGNENAPINGPQQPLTGLEKMQTVQRLAAYANPMQEIAKARLSAFQPSSSHDGVSDHAPDDGPEAVPYSASSFPSSVFPTADSIHDGPLPMKFVSGKELILAQEAEQLRRGGLDLNFRFPAVETPTEISPSMESFTRGSGIPSTHTNTAHSRPPPGLPVPLTAGPPRHRQSGYPSFPRSDLILPALPLRATALPVPMRACVDPPMVNSIYEADSMPSSTNTYNPAFDGWSNFPRGMLRPAKVTGPIRDTESVENVIQYYPHGVPASFGSDLRPMSAGTKAQMVEANAEAAATYARARQNIPDNELQGGISHLNQNSERIQQHWNSAPLPSLRPIGAERAQSFGRESSAPVPNISHDQPNVHDQNIEMTNEAMTHELRNGNNLFGLVHRIFSGNATEAEKSIRNDYSLAPAWMIDDSENGNKSFFGEDLGRSHSCHAKNEQASNVAASSHDPVTASGAANNNGNGAGSDFKKDSGTNKGHSSSSGKSDIGSGNRRA